MKKLTVGLAAVFAVATTSAHAIDLGNGISAGAEIEAEYNFDTEADKITLTPYAGYSAWGINWNVESELDLNNLEDEELDLKWSMNYPWMENANAFVEVETDKDFDTDNLTVGASFKF